MIQIEARIQEILNCNEDCILTLVSKSMGTERRKRKSKVAMCCNSNSQPRIVPTILAIHPRISRELGTTLSLQSCEHNHFI